MIISANEQSKKGLEDFGEAMEMLSPMVHVAVSVIQIEQASSLGWGQASPDQSVWQNRMLSNMLAMLHVKFS
ncbi:MAG: hypothetical protein QXY52_05395 [Conexivisphaerales archaeon]